MDPRSEYVAFLDETGDHSLVSIDASYPVFGLALVVCRRSDYTERIIPGMGALKLRYFDSEGVILRSYDVRKRKGPFSVLRAAPVREAFLPDLSTFVSSAPFTLFYSGIHKARHAEKYRTPNNPYELALEFTLERLERFCRMHGIDRLPIIAESRGGYEDDQLKLAFFERIARGSDYVRSKELQACGFDLSFSGKWNNVAGIQIADLCAYPLGSHQARGYRGPDYDIALSKVFNPDGRRLGLKLFP